MKTQMSELRTQVKASVDRIASCRGSWASFRCRRTQRKDSGLNRPSEVAQRDTSALHGWTSAPPNPEAHAGLAWNTDARALQTWMMVSFCMYTLVKLRVAVRKGQRVRQKKEQTDRYRDLIQMLSFFDFFSQTPVVSVSMSEFRFAVSAALDIVETFTRLLPEKHCGKFHGSQTAVLFFV